MQLVDISNVMALMDDESIRKMYKEDFDKLVEVESWAFKGILFNNFDVLWPVVNGKIMSWGYDFSYIQDIKSLLDVWGREYSFHVIPNYEMPLLIKLKKVRVDKQQGYFVISPKIMAIFEE